ncbi:unnamed protein product [Hymenolepis diminuta]|uniref:Death domain-containing protein n=1 Tax=Hymenolepis diminuta TaxID=6216 RepID=A0A0R3SIU9_HYMDI|nr:unnamed protein product [Hymenolepis diminuta]
MSEDPDLPSHTSEIADEAFNDENNEKELEENEDIEEMQKEVSEEEQKTFSKKSQINDLNDLKPSSNMTPAVLRRTISDELTRLKSMKPAEFVERMEELKNLHRQIYEVAEKFIKEVVDQIPALTPIFKLINEFDQRAYDKALATANEDWDNAGITVEDYEIIMNNLKERMVESAKINFDFTHQISFIASPLTVWRLAACTAIWAGNKELQIAHETTKFDLEDIESRLSGRSDKEDAELAETRAKDDADGLTVVEEERQYELEAAERARVESEINIEGQLNPEEIALSERPAPKDWVKYVYTTRVGDNERVICYVRAPADCLISDDRLICTFGSFDAEWPNLPGNAEVIANFVCIRPKHPKLICILPDEPWIIGIPHTYSKNPTREVVVYAMESSDAGIDNRPTFQDDLEPPQTTWLDMPTSDVVNEDSHYLEFKLPRLTVPLTFAPAVRIRRDSGEIGKAGGKITSLVDKRVTFNIPPGGLKIDCTYSIQVQPINQHHAQILRDQNWSFMSQFTSCSALVTLTGPKKILFKNALITLPLTENNPSNQVIILSNASMPDAFLGRKKEENSEEDSEQREVNVEEKEEGSEGTVSHKGLDPFQSSLLLPKLLAGSNSSHSVVTLMWAGLENSDWKIWKNIEFVDTKNADVCCFSINRIVPRKFMAIETRTAVENECLIPMAQILERSISQRIVYACLRQKNEDPGKVCFALCLIEDLEKTLAQMASKGYTEGAKPIGPLFVYERQRFDINLKGNIRLKNDTLKMEKENLKMKMTFNSALPNEYMIEVKESDPSAQVSCQNYRGFVEMSYMNLVRVPNRRDRTKGRFITELQTVVLCQLLITLPKRESEADIDKTVISYQFEANDGITDESLKQIAGKLSDDSWRYLGAALNLSRTQLQAIGGRAEYLGKNKTLMMLRSWIKHLPLKEDRSDILSRALTTIGRTDLIANLHFSDVKERITTESVSSQNSPVSAEVKQ